MAFITNANKQLKAPEHIQMTTMRWWRLGIILCLCVSCFASVREEYFRFHNLVEGPRSGKVKEEFNFATLKSEKPLSDQFSICSSLLVGFVREYFSFFVIMNEDASDPWFYFDIIVESSGSQPFSFARPAIKGFWVPTSPKSHQLKDWGLQEWTQACVSVDTETGQAVIVVNGEVLLNQSIGQLKSGRPRSLNGALILGLDWQRRDYIRQSEAAIGNVQIYNKGLDMATMVEATHSGKFPEEAYLKWNTSNWKRTGDVRTLNTSNFLRRKERLHYFSAVSTWNQCFKFCSRLQKRGRLPSVRNKTESLKVIQHSKRMINRTALMYASFNDKAHEDNFVDVYTGYAMPNDLFSKGEPDGGESENCIAWSTKSDGLMDDIPCDRKNRARDCFCELQGTIRSRLRGLCDASNLDSFYTITQGEHGEVDFRGLKGTQISLKRDKWEAKTSEGTTTRNILAPKSSHLLGRYEWLIENDSHTCGGDPLKSHTYQTFLKMTSCLDDEFTCWNGDCIPLEQRCDQVFDCDDQSDEKDCQIVLLSDSYKRSVPPLTRLKTGGSKNFSPVKVRVNLTVMDVLAIREMKNEIQINLRMNITWTEVRATFKNLKQRTMLNTLPEELKKTIWIPSIFYTNLNDHFSYTNIKDNMKHSNIIVNREGKGELSGLGTLDETLMFQGIENPLTMSLHDTKTFGCMFQLQWFPFDIQVCIFHFQSLIKVLL